MRAGAEAGKQRGLRHIRGGVHQEVRARGRARVRVWRVLVIVCGRACACGGACACACVGECACVRACVRDCVHARACARAHTRSSLFPPAPAPFVCELYTGCRCKILNYTRAREGSVSAHPAHFNLKLTHKTRAPLIADSARISFRRSLGRRPAARCRSGSGRLGRLARPSPHTAHTHGAPGLQLCVPPPLPSGFRGEVCMKAGAGK